MGQNVFLDSDDLYDLRRLLEHVKDSDVLLLLQSRHINTRPWCLLEMLTAIDNKVPIVAVKLVSKRRESQYEFAEAECFLANLDSMVDDGCKNVLAANGHPDMVRNAWKLSSAIPKVISINFDPSYSKAMLNATVSDVTSAIMAAKATSIPELPPFDEWLSNRPPPSGGDLSKVIVEPIERGEEVCQR